MTVLSRPMAASTGVCLAFVAGSVDATGLAAIGRVSSHLTGTTTHLMVDLIAARAGIAGAGLSVLASFVCGAFCCGAILASRPMRAATRTLAFVIGIEACVIVVGGLAMMVRTAPALSASVAIGLFACAMGVRNATSSHLLAPYRRTSHLTSSFTDLGSEIGVRLRAALGRAVAEPSAAPEPDILSSSALVIAGFSVGAVTGAIGVATIGFSIAPALALVPALAAIWIGRLGTRQGRSPGTP